MWVLYLIDHIHIVVGTHVVVGATTAAARSGTHLFGRREQDGYEKGSK
jgi:hypothetical protein